MNFVSWLFSLGAVLRPFKIFVFFMSNKVDQILEDLKSISLLEASELITKILRLFIFDTLVL